MKEKTRKPAVVASPLQPIVMPLALKKKWFNMILDGKKTEEYREIKDYWARRFLCLMIGGNEIEWAAWDEMLCDMRDPFRRHRDQNELMKFFGVRFKRFDVIHFRNGYHKNARNFKIEFKGFEINRGRIDWGANKRQYYFVLKLGEIIPMSVVSVA